MTAALAPLLLVPSLENKTTLIYLSPFGITIGICFRDQQTWPSIALCLSAHAPTTAHQECLRRLMQALNPQRPSSRLGSAISSQQGAIAQRRSPSPPRRPVRNPSRPRTLLIASPAELRPLETTVEVVAPSIPPSPLFFEPSSREPPARLESPYRPAAGATAIAPTWTKRNTARTPDLGRSSSSPTSEAISETSWPRQSDRKSVV